MNVFLLHHAGGEVMNDRPNYMKFLKTYRDVPLVKILAGVHFSGKSTILEMLKEDFLSLR